MSSAWREGDANVRAGAIQFEWGFEVGTTVQADAKFLRRIFLGLVFMTLLSGGLAGLTTVQAMTGSAGNCAISCE